MLSMTHLPPRSILFPYTTLFRSQTTPSLWKCPCGEQVPPEFSFCIVCGRSQSGERRCSSCREVNEPDYAFCCYCGERSEEHTSELQSRQYLVCRLLLEKKKERHK